MSAFSTLCVSLGAVYLQDPLDAAGYTLSGSNITNVKNLVDGASIAKGGTNTLQIGAICTQPSFAYNPEATSSNTHIRRTGYGAVAGCLQTDFTLFFTADPPASSVAWVLHSYGSSGSPPPFLRVGVTRNTSPTRLTFSVEKSKQVAGSNVVNSASTTSITHHVYELTCSNSAWGLFVDGVSIGSGTWSNSGIAWAQSLVTIQQGAHGHTSTPDSQSITREFGQMVLFPSVLSSGDRTLVRNALTSIMCNGHPRDVTGTDSFSLSDTGVLELVDDENACHHAA